LFTQSPVVEYLCTPFEFCIWQECLHVVTSSSVGYIPSHSLAAMSRPRTVIFFTPLSLAAWLKIQQSDLPPGNNKMSCR
jgi:hypothetical protein